jgi:hypothetical protein
MEYINQWEASKFLLSNAVHAVMVTDIKVRAKCKVVWMLKLDPKFYGRCSNINLSDNEA